MSAGDQSDTYALGRSAAETQRLIRQAQIYGPLTRQFFATTGITAGMKVLDIGSGAGDVALLLADLVGPRGAVIGVEMNPAILDTARARVRAVGWTNVTFLEGDVHSIGLDDDFDAVVGRWFLMYLPDPAAVLQRLLRHLQPGGIVAFQENDFTYPPMSFPPAPCTNKLCNGRHHRRAVADRTCKWARNCIKLILTLSCRERSYASTHPSAGGDNGP